MQIKRDSTQRMVTVISLLSGADFPDFAHLSAYFRIKERRTKAVVIGIPGSVPKVAKRLGQNS